MAVWAVLAAEVEPPEGVEAVEWLLLTTVPIETTADAMERLDWYECRWGIEAWHKILKSGCEVGATAGECGAIEAVLGALERDCVAHSVRDDAGAGSARCTLHAAVG